MEQDDEHSLHDPRDVAAQVESEIPDELKETPPVESVTMLDKRFDDLLAEIRILQESKSKDFQTANSRRDRLASFPNVSYFENFRKVRQNHVDRIAKVDAPILQSNSSEQIQLELKESWNIDEAINGETLLVILKEFFLERSTHLLEESSRVISRWSRFSKPITINNSDLGALQRYLAHLRCEYRDALDRCQRLSEAYEVRTRKAQLEAAAKEAERIAAERNGLFTRDTKAEKQRLKIMAVAKEALKVKKQIEKETREQAERDAKLLLQKEMMTDHDRDVPDDMVDAGFEPADLAVYMRWLAMSHRGVRCLTTYLNRVAASPLAERTQILSDYKMIATLSPGKELLNTIDYYEGINIFMSSCPLKLASVEDFLTEFEIQCTHHKIETKIGDEDGRPFAYEVEGRFTYKFSEQIIESTYLPYDGENDQKSISVQAHEKMPEVSLFDAKFSHYTAAVTSFNSNGFPLPEAPKRARADWTSSVIFLPEFEHWQELQEDLIRNRKEQDFEMLCDFDLICCNDVDFVLPRLKDSARRIWEAASKKANIRPTTAKSSILGKTSPRMIGDDDKKEDDGKHFPNTFNLGMLVPSVEERFSEKRVLDAKKQTFGHILRTNEENLLIEQELLNVDPNRTSNAVPVIEPTIATIFSEHEILAFVQLRHVHLRELRETLKRQLNFLRSVERKINMEFECTQRRQPTSYDNIRVQPSTPYQKPTNEQTLNGFSKVPDVFDLKSATRTSHDDVRVIEAGRAVVRDQRGISILYDVAIDDMKQLEKQLIKIATIYINKGLGGREPVSSAYVDELRYRMTDRRTDIKDVTYLNPEADRSQILLELFSHEVKFQYAKIDVINAYLEALEHSVDRKGIDELSQTITNLIHARPHFDFGAPYFSKNYVLATKAFDAQARMVVAATNQLILGHRDWILRCGDSALKAKKDGRPEHEIVESCDTVLPFGLPYSNHSESDIISMHHAGVKVHMTEVISIVSHVARIPREARKVENDLHSLLETLGPTRLGESPSRSIINIIVWKTMDKLWNDMSDYNFVPPLRGRRLVGGLDSDVWLEHPLLPDWILKEHYKPFDAPSEKALASSVAQLTIFTDPSYQPFGRDLLCRLLKLLILRNRLLHSWLQTDFWKFCFEDQFAQMNVNKANYTGRLGELRYDVPEMADTTVVEDDDFVEFDQAAVVEPSADQNDAGHAIFDACVWRVGPLAVAELDEGLSLFDFSKLKSILHLCREAQLQKMTRALKIQLIEKNWHMSAAEIHGFILHDIHRDLLESTQENDAQRFDEAKIKGRSVRQKPWKAGNEVGTRQFDVDYRTLVTSFMPKKRQMRRAMVIEYAREMRNVTKKDVSDNEKELELLLLKYELIDWYFANMCEVVVEECERAEFTQVMLDLRNFAFSGSFGKVIFRSSKVLRNSDYFTDLSTKQVPNGFVDMEKIVQVQDLAATDMAGTEKLGKLWLLPHPTECLMAFGTHERSPKAQVDMNQKVFKNSMVYCKAMRVHRLIFEILRLVAMFSKYLSDNNRFIQSVRDLREADYIITTMNQIKKDLSYQGNTAEYSRVESYLISKWRIWFLRNRLAIASIAYAVHMKMLPNDYKSLLRYEELMAQSKDLYILRYRDWDLTQIYSFTTKPQYTRLPSSFCFSKLHPEAKKCAENKIVELDDCMEQYLQATLLNFGENTEEVNKTQSEYLVTGLRLYILRKEFNRLTLQGDVIKNEAQLSEVIKFYKMRIVVGAVRLYFKLGARGNATAGVLLRDVSIVSAADSEMNRQSQAAFERCQISVLLGELVRLHTVQMLRQAKQYYDKLADERAGRLFQLYDTIEVNAQRGERAFAYKLSEDISSLKTNILLTFVEDLHKANASWLKERKVQQGALQPFKLNEAKGQLGNLLPLDDSKMFSCTKDSLTQAIIKLSLNISKLAETRLMEQEHFEAALVNRLIDQNKNAEKAISTLQDEKRELLENFHREVRLAAAHSVADIYAELGAMATEVNELRKSRRVEERKLRNRIIDEYDDMVGELVMENHVLRNRFNEYRTNTVHEVMGIIAETKKEELMLVAKSNEIPQPLRASAQKTIEYEDMMNALKEDNHELQMTLLKVRSMYSIKEQSLRSAYDKKIRKLSEESKHAEEKLWDSYKDAESRERAIRRMLTRTTKSLVSSESHVESLQKMLREEQAKFRPATSSRTERSFSAKPKSETSDTKAVEFAEKLKKLEGINIEKLIAELTEKTLLVEELVQKLRVLEHKHDNVLSHERGKSAAARLNGTFSGASVRPPRFSSATIRKLEQLAESRKVNAIRQSVKISKQNKDDVKQRELEDLLHKFGQLLSENALLKRKMMDMRSPVTSMESVGNASPEGRMTGEFISGTAPAKSVNGETIVNDQRAVNSASSAESIGLNQEAWERFDEKAPGEEVDAFESIEFRGEIGPRSRRSSALRRGRSTGVRRSRRSSRAASADRLASVEDETPSRRLSSGEAGQERSESRVSYNDGVPGEDEDRRPGAYRTPSRNSMVQPSWASSFNGTPRGSISESRKGESDPTQRRRQAPTTDRVEESPASLRLYSRLAAMKAGKSATRPDGQDVTPTAWSVAPSSGEGQRDRPPNGNRTKPPVSALSGKSYPAESKQKDMKNSSNILAGPSVLGTKVSRAQRSAFVTVRQKDLAGHTSGVPVDDARLRLALGSQSDLISSPSILKVRRSLPPQ